MQYTTNFEKKAETLVSVVIAVVILGFLLLGITSILGFNKGNNNDYEQQVLKHILEANTKNIIKKIDISDLEEEESFMVFKDLSDPLQPEIRALSSSNTENIYAGRVDNFGLPLSNGDVNDPEVFEQVLVKKRDILRNYIPPRHIPNLVFHLDATQLTGYSDGDEVTEFTDISGNNLNFLPINADTYNDAHSGTNYNYRATRSNGSNAQSITGGTFRENAIFNKPLVEFNGINNIYTVDGNQDGYIGSTYHGGGDIQDSVYHTINTYNDAPVGLYNPQPIFPEKSMTIVIKTSDNIYYSPVDEDLGENYRDGQMIYEQGSITVGYNFYIKNGEIYAGVHNTLKGDYRGIDYSEYIWENDHEFKSVKLTSILPNSIYFITIVQDSKYTDENGNEIDSENRLKIYMNDMQTPIEQDHVDPMPGHHELGLGGVLYANVDPSGNGSTDINCGSAYNTCAFFKGGIGEFMQWNHALSDQEVYGLHNYLSQKWIYNNEPIEYDTVEVNIQ